jgi:hypothetical protein
MSRWDVENLRGSVPGVNTATMGRTRKENMLAKYLLLKHYRGGPAPAVDWAPMDQWMPDEVDAHVQFMRDFAAGGRHAPAVLPVRAPIPDTGLGRRAHAARGRRPDHESDRTGLPRAGGDHGPADQQGQADRSGVRFNQSGDVPRCCACSIWSSMRATPAMSTSPPRRSGSPANWRPRPTMRRSRAYLRSCRCTAHGVRHGPAPTAASCATEQDRSLWDTRLIAEGVDVHQAPSPATDWGSSRLCSPC